MWWFVPSKNFTENNLVPMDTRNPPISLNISPNSCLKNNKHTTNSQTLFLHFTSTLGCFVKREESSNWRIFSLPWNQTILNEDLRGVRGGIIHSTFGKHSGSSHLHYTLFFTNFSYSITNFPHPLTNQISKIYISKERHHHGVLGIFFSSHSIFSTFSFLLVYKLQ